MPIAGAVRGGLMVGVPVRVLVGVEVGVRDGLMVAMPLRVIVGEAVGEPVDVGVGEPVDVGVGVGVGVLVWAKAPVVPPESNATVRTPVPSVRP
ncbi:hypothetical protein [Streptomyces sp. RB17]|uniref:hypothetical protein n=1 Tax=Streptomyces sp. RB17 TaxID=2585197 RepID=UPI0012962020|nr:hypothetical protein [Streptomyces sp. RB17]